MILPISLNCIFPFKQNSPKIFVSLRQYAAVGGASMQLGTLLPKLPNVFKAYTSSIQLSNTQGVQVGAHPVYIGVRTGPTLCIVVFTGVYIGEYCRIFLMCILASIDVFTDVYISEYCHIVLGVCTCKGAYGWGSWA
jgi:hypothetical protein